MAAKKTPANRTERPATAAAAAPVRIRKPLKVVRAGKTIKLVQLKVPAPPSGQYLRRVILDAPAPMSPKDKREIASLVKLMRTPA